LDGITQHRTHPAAAAAAAHNHQNHLYLSKEEAEEEEEEEVLKVLIGYQNGNGVSGISYVITFQIARRKNSKTFSKKEISLGKHTQVGVYN
jgi:hypothetical protein